MGPVTQRGVPAGRSPCLALLRLQGSAWPVCSGRWADGDAIAVGFRGRRADWSPRYDRPGPGTLCRPLPSALLTALVVVAVGCQHAEAPRRRQRHRQPTTTEPAAVQISTDTPTPEPLSPAPGPAERALAAIPAG